MENLFKNKFYELNLHEEEKYLADTYFATSADMEEEDFKEIVLKSKDIVRIAKKNSISRLLSDNRNFLYPIAPNVQEWAAKITSEIEFPESTKIAIVVSADLISSLSMEQTIDEYQKEQNGKIEVKYFDDMMTAKKWLLA